MSGPLIMFFFFNMFMGMLKIGSFITKTRMAIELKFSKSFLTVI